MSFHPPAAATSTTDKSFLLVAQALLYACHNEPSSFGLSVLGARQVMDRARIPHDHVRVGDVFAVRDVGGHVWSARGAFAVSL